MQRLAALVPRPRLHLIRLVSAQLRFAKSADPRCANHGVLAPNAKLRAMVVLHGPDAVTGESQLAATESSCTPSRPAHIS